MNNYCIYLLHILQIFQMDPELSLWQYFPVNDNSNYNMKDAIIATDYINVYDDKNINININNNYQKMKIFFREI